MTTRAEQRGEQLARIEASIRRQTSWLCVAVGLLAAMFLVLAYAALMATP